MLRIMFYKQAGIPLSPTTRITATDIRGNLLFFSIWVLDKRVGTLGVSLKDLLNLENCYINLTGALISDFLGPVALSDLAKEVNKGKYIIDFVKTYCRICKGEGRITPKEGCIEICPHCFGKGQEWVLKSEAEKEGWIITEEMGVIE